MFGPDGKLYAIVGDGHDATNAQDRTGTSAARSCGSSPTARAGRQPVRRQPHVVAYGIRNSFGFTFDPQTDACGRRRTAPSATTRST